MCYVVFVVIDMHEALGSQPGVSRPVPDAPANLLGTALYGAGSGLIRGGLGTYGERIFGSGSDYVQSNVSVVVPLDLSIFDSKICIGC